MAVRIFHARSAFRCEEPNCGRLFTRHDNLLQHLKNNRHSSFSDSDCRPLDRVLPAHDSESMCGEPMSVSPSMGVLLPSETAALAYSQLPMTDVEGSPGIDAASSGSCEVSSPEGTPAPTEQPCVYDRRYMWPAPDVFPLTQYEYSPPPQPPPHIHAMAAGMALGIYGYQS